MSQTRTPLVVEIANVRSEPVRWLWPGLVPRGKLTVLCGDPGLGKSFLTLDMASRASRGGPWPGGEGAPGEPEASLLLSAEDDPVDTIRPRLESMGADLGRISLLAGMRTIDGLLDEVDLSYDVRALANEICGRSGLALVVVDPVSAFVGATDSYNNAQVRAMLKPLSDMAADSGAAVVLVTHLRKGEGGPAVQRAMGSLAFTAAARQVLVAMRDRTDPDGRVLAVAKSNLGRDRLSVPYRIEEGRVEYGEPLEASADELSEGARPAHRPPSPANERFAEMLRKEMAEPGFVEQDQARRIAEACGANWNSVRHPAWRESHGLEVLDLDGKKLWTTRD